MKLYLDVCSLNRPFDNQIQDRIHFGKVDVLLTTDDHLIRKANQSNKVKIRIENPVKWLLEVVNHEYPDKKS